MTRATLTLDIETVPLLSALAEPYPAGDRPLPANYKSEQAIRDWREKDKARWERERVSTLSLNPRTCRILAIGMYSHNGLDDAKLISYAETEDGEAEMLVDFWRQVEHNPRIITWNGTWDLRVIVLRSLRHRIVPSLPAQTIRAWFRKYDSTAHLDLKAVLLNWPSGYPTGEGLSQWAAFFGLEGKTPGLDGGDVYPLFLAGHHDEVKEYCLGDVVATHNIYRATLPLTTE